MKFKTSPTKDALIITERIYYDYSKYAILPEAEKVLDKVVNIMEKNPLLKIEISSFTDSRSSSGLLTFQPNSAGIWEKVGNKQTKIFAFNSTNALSIPIFISFTQSQFPQITVEHTHPPAEYFWGNHARKSALTRIRRTWSTK